MAYKQMNTHVNQLSTEYYPTEQPRRLIRGTWHGIAGSAIHLPALLFTAVLLWLNFSRVYWFDETGLSNGPFTSAGNILNALQLAAKVYELAVVASLADVTLKAFKRRLVGDGLPMGILSGGYRVGDVFYIFSSRFWTGAGRAFWLAIFLATNTLLTVLVGPASAILIVPELGWYPLPGAFAESPMPIYLGLPERHWPKILEESLWEGSSESHGYCRAEQGSFQPICPASGFANLFSWAAGWEASGLPNSIVFHDPSGNTSRRLDMVTNKLTGTFSTTPMSVTSLTLGQLQSYIRHKNVGAISDTLKYKLELATETSSNFYQPLVNSKCNVWNLERYKDMPEVPQMFFPSGELNCFSEDESDACHKMRDIVGGYTIVDSFWNGSETGAAYSLGTTEDVDNPTLSSITFVARLPFNNNGALGKRFMACSFLAHWIPTTFLIDPSKSDIIQTNTTKLDIFTTERGWREANGDLGLEVIRINETWLPFLDPGFAISRGTPNEDGEASNTNDTLRPAVEQSSSIGSLFMAFMSREGVVENGSLPHSYIGPGSGKYAMDLSSDEQVRVDFEKFLGALITDAISRTEVAGDPIMVVPHRDENSATFIHLPTREGPGISKITVLANGTQIHEDGEVDPEPLKLTLEKLMTRLNDKFVKLDFHAEQYGYGYGQGEETMVFAKAVILTYIVILFLYCIRVTFSGSVTVAAWGDLQDLLALVWSSSAPLELTGKGAAVTDGGFWKENVTVRATPSRRVAMVLDDEQPGLLQLRRHEGYW